MPATSTNASVDAKHARPDARRERGREEARPMRRGPREEERARSTSVVVFRQTADEIVNAEDCPVVRES
jgi:hypothetical protein